jgi:D-threo-aldose 1-dehydrogenase
MLDRVDPRRDCTLPATVPNPIERRPLGQAGLSVTPVCVGCAALGNMPETFAFDVPEERALTTVRAIFASKLNFLDTSPSYGDGESERRIGLVVRELTGVPSGYLLATKADRDLATGEFTGDQIRRSVERSLRLLGVDHLMLCHLHDPENSTFEHITEPGGALDALLGLREQGVIRHLGIAGGPIDLMIRFVELGCFETVITHNRYTLLDREANPLLDIAFQRGMGVLNAAPYGSGLLAKGPSSYPRYMYRNAPSAFIDRARRIEAICQGNGVPLAAAALQFSLRDPRISSTIVGMTHPERIQQTIDLARHPIPDALWEEIELTV